MTLQLLFIREAKMIDTLSILDDNTGAGEIYLATKHRDK